MCHFVIIICACYFGSGVLCILYDRITVTFVKPIVTCLVPSVTYLIHSVTYVTPTVTFVIHIVTCLLPSMTYLIPSMTYITPTVTCLNPSMTYITPTVTCLLLTVTCVRPIEMYLISTISHPKSVVSKLYSSFCCHDCVFFQACRILPTCAVLGPILMPSYPILLVVLPPLLSMSSWFLCVATMVTV